MTPEKQRIAIAEACGWTHSEAKGLMFPADIMKRATIYGQSPPDYLNDLNAMHEAEKVLTGVQRLAYTKELGLITKERWATNENGIEEIFPWIHATAAQRAEAFLRTLNLWTDA